MTHPAKALSLGTAALLAATLNAALFAQAPNAQPGARAGANAADANANAVNANAADAAADEEHHTQQLITHALNMAVNGSDLQLAAHAHGRSHQGRGQGEGQDRNRNAGARDENNANGDRNANAENRRDADAGKTNNDKANAENRRDANADTGARRDGGQDSQSHEQAVRQLREHASRQFEGGTRLLRDAEANLNAGGRNAAGAPGEASRNAWSRRLYTAADEYATTLRALTGVGSGARGASGTHDDQNQRDRAGANRNQAERSNDHPRNEANGSLNSTEAAQVALLNQAVREAIEAFELDRSHHHAFGANQGARVNASARRLQEHARQMAADSQQIVQQVQAAHGNRDQNPQGDQNRDGQGDRNRNRNRDGQGDRDQNRDGRAGQDRNAEAANQGGENARHGKASVRVLAQQAQQIVETLQRINPAAAAAAPAR